LNLEKFLPCPVVSFVVKIHDYHLIREPSVDISAEPQALYKFAHDTTSHTAIQAEKGLHNDQR